MTFDDVIDSIHSFAFSYWLYTAKRYLLGMHTVYVDETEDGTIKA